MEEPWLPAHLNHTLLNLLSSPQIKLVGEQLRISNHLDMIRDSLWAINAVITDANRRANKESKLKKWLHDVNAAIASIKDILKCLQEEQKQEVAPPPCPPILLHLCQISSTSTLSLSSPRHAILIKLKQITQSLNCLLSRANAFDLKIETMDSMDPNQDEYYSILEQTVPKRYEDVKKVLKIIFRIGGGQPLWELNEDVPFVTIITGKAWTDKSILARMVYLHPLAREFFKHRIWVDVFNCASVSFDPMHIATECAKQLTGKVSSDDVESWRLIRSSLPEKRFLLILDRINEITMEDEKKWEELKKNLLSSSAPGSRVIITCHFCNIKETDQEAAKADQMSKHYHKIYRLDNISDDEEKRKRYPWHDEEKRKRYPLDDEKEENDDDDEKEEDNISGDGDEKEEEDNTSDDKKKEENDDDDDEKGENDNDNDDDDEKGENDDDEKKEKDNISGDGDETEEEDNISDDKEKEDNASNDEKEKKNIPDDKKEEKDNISDDEKKGKDNISDEGEGPNDSGDD